MTGGGAPPPRTPRGLHQLTIRLYVFDQAGPGYVLQRFTCHVEHALVMLSPLVWTQGVAGVLASFGFTRQDTNFYVMTGRGGRPKTTSINDTSLRL